MSEPRICWDHRAIQYATQVDVGGLELDDEYADAVFRAVHVSLPVRRVRDASSAPTKTSSATEAEVLSAFTEPLSTNEPLLLFVTGKKGTGKSHLVRWLKSKVGNPQGWHVVYVEKRNTSLRKVIERILDGIDTPTAAQLRTQLDEASSVITTDAEAIDSLLARVNHLVKHDDSAEVRGLPGLTPAELTDLRNKADRLLGDYTFRKVLSREEGPLARIVHLARGGTDPTESIDEGDLHLREFDLKVDPSDFLDTGKAFQDLIGTLVSNSGFRSEVADLCDYYLPRAKAEVFTGQTTNLIDVFQDVRREVARRGQELCLYIEDLVLLHGIDKQLAQALTVPADKELCRLRAAIAVTSGYLLSVDTFTDRGIHFTLDIDVESVGAANLRDFVAGYLNVGRLVPEQLMSQDSNAPVLNGCNTCPIVRECHATFGVSSSGFGLFPFNGSAVDRLVSLASTDGFQPREVLREVIRLPLDTAESELPQRGVFPSGRFAKSLDEVRQNVPVELRARIQRENPDGFAEELSLRSFYALTPPTVDAKVETIAKFLSVTLTEGIDDVQDVDTPEVPNPPTPTRDEVTAWANGDAFLGSTSANKVRRYVSEAVVDYLRFGAFGLPVRKPRNTEWKIGEYVLRVADVEIARSQGGLGTRGDLTFQIERSDQDAVLVRGLIAAADSAGRLDLVDRGQWVTSFNRRVEEFAEQIASRAASDISARPEAIQVLALLRQATTDPGTTAATALPALLRPIASGGSNPVLREFVDATRPQREEALQAIRDQATSAKGRGKPSVLDVAPLLPALKAAMTAKELLPDQSGDSVAAPIVQAVASRQARASRALGSQVAGTLAGLSAALDPDEDLAAALSPIDKMITDAHTHGLLPHADTLSRYEMAKQALDASAMSVYRELSIMYAAGMPSAALWLGRTDPLPILKGLLDFVSVVSQVMAYLEAEAVRSDVDHSTTDAARVIASLRLLADELDTLSKQER